MRTLLLPVLLFLWNTPNTEGAISQIGNDDIPSTAVIRGAPGLTMLISAQVTAESTLFAVRAYFIGNSSMSVQVWRPSPVSPSFQLVADIPIVPSVQRDSQDIYFSQLTGQCVHLMIGDTLAAYFPHSETPVPYVFNSDMSTAQVLTYTVENPLAPPTVGRVVRFDNLAFPYRFSLAGYSYRDDSQGASPPTDQCPPSNIRIPAKALTTTPTLTTTLPRTAPHGDTGATGSQGSQGATGPRGSVGVSGDKGAPGPPGYTGGTGPVGKSGSPGYPGETGPVGKQGVMGHTGDTGPLGAMGGAGATGLMGPDGPPAQYTGDSGSTLKPPVPGDEESGRWWRKRWVMVMVYVWLAVLSFISLLILLWSIVLCCVYCRGRRRLDVAAKRNYPAYISAYNSESDAYGK